MKTISILGSTGSIGTQTLEVVDNIGTINVLGLTGYKNIALLEQQIRKYHPQFVAVMDEPSAKALKENCKNLDVQILTGLEGIIQVATLPQIDTVVNALVGNIGLLPTVKAIEAKKDIALANKETLVSAGELVMGLAKENNVSIYPVDSEHSAIFQCLPIEESLKNKNTIHKIYLTASGGPFRGKKKADLENVTVKDALAHPNWSMGAKISIDSATLMNKGLEVIEAKWLFDLSLSQIQVLVHPQSIIHSMVEFEDGSVMAQLGEADMRLPIQYALTFPKREKSDFKRINFLEKNQLTFEEPDLHSFPCLNLAFQALEIGGTMPAVLNGANEMAVSLFLEEKISFLQIPLLIEKTMKAYTVKYNFTLEEVLEADRFARAYVMELI